MDYDLEEDCAGARIHSRRAVPTKLCVDKDVPDSGFTAGLGDNKLDSECQSVIDSGIGPSFESESIKSSHGSHDSATQQVEERLGQLNLQDSQAAKPIEDYVHAIYSQDEDGDNQLIIAIIQLMPEVACGMIQKVSTPELLNLHNNFHQTALHMSVLMKLHPVTLLLLSNGADPQIVDCTGNTPLHIACREGDEKSIMLLTRPLKQDVNALNFEGLSCLHLATRNNHARVIYYMSKKCDANINIKDGKSGRTPLHYAAEENNKQLVEMLLNWDADIEALTYDQSTPLRLAGGRHHHDIVQSLMSCGADPDALASFSSESSEDESDEADMDDDIRIGGELV